MNLERITRIDLSNNKELIELTLYGKYNLPIDFGNNTKLKKLYLGLYTDDTYEHSID